MNILQSWGQSLKLFAPANFMLFTLVTLKSFITTYTKLFIYWFWLPPIIIGLDIVVHDAILKSKGLALVVLSFSLMLLCWLLAGFLFLYVIHLITRPSVDAKRCAYFRTYSYKVGWLWATLFIALSVIAVSYVSARLNLKVVHDITSLFMFVSLILGMPIAFVWNFFHAMDWQMLAVFLYSAPVSFFFLFWLDAYSILHVLEALVRAIKMFIYNFPVCMVLQVLLFGIMQGVSYVVPYGMQTLAAVGGPVWLVPAVSKLLFLLFAPIAACIWTNVYILKVHQQPEVYLHMPE